MLNNTSYEVLFYNALDGKQIRSGSTLQEEEWATLTCGHSWPTQGIWPACSDGSDINSLDRSHSRKVLATGDDFSKVKLFRYPVCVEKQPYAMFKGHSSHITKVQFTSKDNLLVSAGGLEKSVIQWKYSGSDYVPEEAEPEPEEPVGGGEFDQFALEEEEGDQAMATIANFGQVRASIPDWYKPNPRHFNRLPD